MPPFNQDDQRERAMVSALNLLQRETRARHDEDAHLDVEIDGKSYRLLFECKSAPESTDFGTGRDTGLTKLESWKSYHFVFASIPTRDNVINRMWYASPRMMRAWIDGEITYLQTDIELAKLIPSKVDDEAVTLLFGDKQVITHAEMSAVMKGEWNANRARGLPNRYEQYADIRQSRRASERLYSRAAGLQAARDRITYLLNRGVTTNNRHIGYRYVTENCAELDRKAWVKSFEKVLSQELKLEPPSMPNS
jgi:hypothetical protein